MGFSGRSCRHGQRDHDARIVLEGDPMGRKLANRVVAGRDLAEGAFDRIRANIDPEWIEEALAATGTATLRRRRLPAEQVVWLVIGMALMSDRSITDVARHLDLALP